ncbi:MAG: LCP family protein [Blautia sp.]|nr:LCP family protein [Blautia sp.]
MKKNRFPGILLTLVLLSFSAVFLLLLYRIHIIPNKLLAIGAVILLVIVLFLSLLIADSGKKGIFSVGLILSLMYALLLIAGSYYLIQSGTAVVNSIPGVENSVLTLYISGIDSQEENASADDNARSDVNIVAVINLATHQMLLVSTPRDYYIPLSISDGVPDKLTHAGIYGIQVSMDTLGMLYDINLRNYVRVDFSGFDEIVDALGGITVWSDYDFDSQNILGYHFSQGENHLNGEEALVFARERFAFEDGDRQRGRNQMALIKAIVQKAASPEIASRLPQLLTSLDGAFSTNLSMTDLAKLAISQASAGMSDWNMYTYSVDGYSDTQIPYSLSEPVYVMVPDETTVEQAKALMQQVRNGEALPQG